MNIPMNTKPPMKLSEIAAAENTKIRQPQTLNDIPQMTGSHHTSRPEQTVSRVQAARPGQPVNRAPAAKPRQAAKGTQATQTGQSVNRAQAVQILPGVKPGLEMKKGQKVSLTQKNPNLTEIDVCMGWKVRNPMCDLDASAFLLGADQKVPGEDWFVFYGQTASPDGSVIHRGDNRSGTGSRDVEILRMKLNRVAPNIKKIVFIITINEALAAGFNFSMVSDTYIRVVDRTTNSEIVRFVLDEYYSNVTSMVVGEIYERNAEWKFHAVGNGVAKDLPGLCELYGIQASY